MINGNYREEDFSSAYRTPQASELAHTRVGCPGKLPPCVPWSQWTYPGSHTTTETLGSGNLGPETFWDDPGHPCSLFLVRPVAPNILSSFLGFFCLIRDALCLQSAPTRGSDCCKDPSLNLATPLALHFSAHCLGFNVPWLVPVGHTQRGRKLPYCRGHQSRWEDMVCCGGGSAVYFPLGHKHSFIHSFIHSQNIYWTPIMYWA